MAQINFRPAAQLIKDAQNIAICGHINPDGDSIGSTLALGFALKKLGKEVRTLVPKKENLEQYDFLPGYSGLQAAAKFEKEVDLFVLVDVAVSSRIGDANHAFNTAKKTLIIDHHQHCDLKADYIVSDPDACATGLLVWDFIKQLELDVCKETALCCLTAIVTDTGRFQYQNADAKTFYAAAEMVRAGADASEISLNIYQRKTRAALELSALAVQRAEFFCDGKAVISCVRAQDFSRLGANKQDAEGLIDVIRQFDGIEIAVILREQGDAVRASIRSKNDRDVASIASSFGGGGHKAAAGFTIENSLDAAKKIVVDALYKEFE